MGPPSPPPSSSSPPPSPTPCDDLHVGDDNDELDLPPLPEVTDTTAIAEVALKNKNVENTEAVFEDINESPVDIKRHGLRARAPPQNLASPVKLTVPWKPINPHEEVSPPRPVRAGRIRKPPPCTCHTREPTRTRKRKKKPENIDKFELIDQHILKHLPDLTNNNTKGIRLDLDPVLHDTVSRRTLYYAWNMMMV